VFGLAWFGLEGKRLAVGVEVELVLVLRILSMEKLRFFAGCGGRIISDAASKTSVGVLGGEASDEKLEDNIDLGDEDGNNALGEAMEAGESQTLIIGEDVSLRPSSVLI